jgi:hypothetical protein
MNANSNLAYSTDPTIAAQIVQRQSGQRVGFTSQRPRPSPSQPAIRIVPTVFSKVGNGELFIPVELVSENGLIRSRTLPPTQADLLRAYAEGAISGAAYRAFAAQFNQGQQMRLAQFIRLYGIAKLVPVTRMVYRKNSNAHSVLSGSHNYMTEGSYRAARDNYGIADIFDLNQIVITVKARNVHG